MTVSKRAFLAWWLGGLAIFAFALWLHAPLAIEAVPGGILDHQAAPDAATVNSIQTAWRREGLWNQAAIAMIADLVFIGVYSVGSILGGMYFRAHAGGPVAALGWIATFLALTIALATQCLSSSNA